MAFDMLIENANVTVFGEVVGTFNLVKNEAIFWKTMKIYCAYTALIFLIVFRGFWLCWYAD